MSIEIKPIQVFQLTLEDLSTVIREAVATELQKVNNIIQLKPNSETSDLLSRADTSKLLGVSTTTLFHWNNDNTLPAQKIGGRVYYQKSVIMNKLNNVA